MRKFAGDINQNLLGNIKYRNNVVTGVVAVDNGNYTYDVYISSSEEAYPNVPTTMREPDFAVGDAVEILIEYGNKEMPIIIGLAKKIVQEIQVIDINTLVTTLNAYNTTETSTYFEGRIEEIDGYENCLLKGFHYGLTTSYGTDIYTTGSFEAGAYSLQATGLNGNTDYNFAAYVYDADGDEQKGDNMTMKTIGYTLYEYSLGDIGAWPSIEKTNQKLMQSFTAESNHNINKVGTLLGIRYADKNIGNVNLTIFASSDGYPVGNVLTSGTIDGNDLPLWGGDAYTDIAVTQTPLTNAVQYSLVLTCDAFWTSGVDTQRLLWERGDGTYANGLFDRYSSGVWENYTSGKSDVRFKIYGSS